MAAWTAILQAASTGFQIGSALTSKPKIERFRRTSIGAFNPESGWMTHPSDRVSSYIEETSRPTTAHKIFSLLSATTGSASSLAGAFKKPERKPLEETMPQEVSLDTTKTGEAYDYYWKGDKWSPSPEGPSILQGPSIGAPTQPNIIMQPEGVSPVSGGPSVTGPPAMTSYINPEITRRSQERLTRAYNRSKRMEGIQEGLTATYDTLRDTEYFKYRLKRYGQLTPHMPGLFDPPDMQTEMQKYKY